MRVNGTVAFTTKSKADKPAQDVYLVTLKGGPMDKHQTLATDRVAYLCGHRYALNSEGDFVYSPLVTR